MNLDHDERDCCGLWRQQLISGRLYWRCQNCEAIAHGSTDAAETALRVNQLGVTLRQLSDAGDFLNLSESEEPWQW